MPSSRAARFLTPPLARSASCRRLRSYSATSFSRSTPSAGSLAAVQTRPLMKKDHVCAHEEVFYPPLTKVGHSMPAFTMAHSFKGKDLGTTWSSPDKRSAFVADFQLND